MIRFCRSKISGPPCRAVVFVCISGLLITALCPAGLAGQRIPVESEPDDRLPREREAAVGELIERGDPEAVEKLLAGVAAMHRVHVARAYGRAGGKALDPAERERLLGRAVEEYQAVISLEMDPRWFRGLRRQFDVIQWRVELADLILGLWSGPDLDRFEVTSGLDFDRKRLVARLEQADSLYSKARRKLDKLTSDMRDNETDYLLLGLTGRINSLVQQVRRNGAWAALYLAQACEPAWPRRQERLETALAEFDSVSRAAKEAPSRYNALLGAGIALRESGRFAEAEAAFDRVVNSTAGSAVVARAIHERAREMLAARQFERARAEFARLSAMTPSEPGASFYVRLAPMLRAYVDIVESGMKSCPPRRKHELADRASDALNALASRGGPLAEASQLYLAQLPGHKPDLGVLPDAELVVTAERLMSAENYAEAAEALRMLLGRPDAKARHFVARFNLAVCHFHLNELRAAAETFSELAGAGGDSSEVSNSAVVYAYQCWRALAGTTKEVADYSALTLAASRLVLRVPDHALADEARWVAALANQEAGNLGEAFDGYARVPPQSPHYWQARRGMAICAQRRYEAAVGVSSPHTRKDRAVQAAAAWSDLADKLHQPPVNPKKSDSAQDRPAKYGDEFDRAAWLTEARYSAAEALACDDLRSFREALAHLEAMPRQARALALRLRCLRGLENRSRSEAELTALLTDLSDPKNKNAWVELASALEAEVDRLVASGHSGPAALAALDAAGVFSRLLDTQGQSDEASQVAAARLGLARMLALAGKHESAREQFDRLIADDPTNGSLLLSAARMEEDAIRGADGTDADIAPHRAESLWARLLADETLRDRAPAEYWEARYYWLAHQLRQGRADEVARGIAAERAWYPELGGPPWQDKLSHLAEQARAQSRGG